MGREELIDLVEAAKPLLEKMKVEKEKVIEKFDDFDIQIQSDESSTGVL